MASYTYIDKSGNQKTIDAPDANSAINNAADRASNSGVMLNQNTPAPTPAPTTSAPTNNKSKNSSTSNNTGNTGNTGYTDGTLTDKEEQAIRDRIIGSFQGEINAATNAYTALLNEQKQLGVGRLGEDTAVQARRGLQGSDFGAAATEGVRGLNLKNEQSVLESKATAIASIMARAQAAAEAAVSGKRAAKQAGADSYNDYIFNVVPAQKKENLKNVMSYFFASSIDPNTLGNDQLAKIAKGYGLSTQDILNSYYNEKETRDKEAKGEGFSLGEGQRRYDASGKEVAYNPQTYAPKNPTEGDIKKLLNTNYSQALSGITGDDGYVSPEDYKKYKKAYIEDGGDAQSFDDSFIVYANPAGLKAYNLNKDIYGQVNSSNKGDELQILEALLNQ